MIVVAAASERRTRTVQQLTLIIGAAAVIGLLGLTVCKYTFFIYIFIYGDGGANMHPHLHPHRTGSVPR